MNNANTALQTRTAPTKPKALEIMASRLSLDPVKMLATLKATVFKGASDDELAALVVVSNEYGLNPFLKEIYAFPAKGGGIVPVVSVDGWNKMMIRQPDFDGVEFEFYEDPDNAEAPPISCTITVYVKNRSRPVKITEYFDECQRNTDNWKNMPHRMLRNRALCQGARIAFGFSGIHNEEEALDVAATVVMTDAPAKPEPKRISNAETKPALEDGHATLQAFLDENDSTFNLLTLWGDQTGAVPELTNFSTLEEVPAEVVKRILRIKRNDLIAGLTLAKESTKR